MLKLVVFGFVDLCGFGLGFRVNVIYFWWCFLGEFCFERYLDLDIIRFGLWDR